MQCLEIGPHCDSKNARVQTGTNEYLSIVAMVLLHAEVTSLLWWSIAYCSGPHPSPIRPQSTDNSFLVDLIHLGAYSGRVRRGAIMWRPTTHVHTGTLPQRVARGRSFGAASE